MITLRLSIPSPVLCLGASVGTVALIRALQASLGCGLAEAKRHVDRCVFEGEEVVLSLASLEEALAVQQAVLAAAPDLLVVTLETT